MRTFTLVITNMRFSDVIGQEQVKARLLETVKEGRVSHAQLFLGPEGSGNLASALAYARYILCQQRKEDDACEECHACQMSAKLTHPDLHFSFPVILSSKVSVSDHLVADWRKAVLEMPYMTTGWWYNFLGEEKKQGVIGVKESDDVVRKLSLKSYEGGYKIMVLWCPELLNTAAANKLLKIIEEPPAGTLFLLVAGDHEKILPTILSRTQMVKFSRLSREQITQGLQSQLSLPGEQAEALALLADGNYFEALQLAKHGNEEQVHFVQFRNWMRICFRKDVKGAVYWADEMASQGREKQKRLLAYALHLFRECVIGNYVGDEQVRLAGQERDFTLNFAPYVKSTNLLDLTEAFTDAHQHVERNANARILFLDLSFKVFRLLNR